MLVAYLTEDFTLHTKHQKMYNVSVMIALMYTMKKALCSLYPEDKVIEMMADSMALICAVPSMEMLPRSNDQGMLYSTINILSSEDIEDLERILRGEEEEFVAVFTSFGDTQSIFYSPKEDGVLSACLLVRKLVELLREDDMLRTEALLRIENDPVLSPLLPTMELILSPGGVSVPKESLN